jgi:hypothetical protein
MIGLCPYTSDDLSISVHNVAMGPVEILLVLVVLGLVAYVLWRLVVRLRR